MLLIIMPWSSKSPRYRNSLSIISYKIVTKDKPFFFICSYLFDTMQMCSSNQLCMLQMQMAVIISREEKSPLFVLNLRPVNFFRCPFLFIFKNSYTTFSWLAFYEPMGVHLYKNGPFWPPLIYLHCSMTDGRMKSRASRLSGDGRLMMTWPWPPKGKGYETLTSSWLPISYPEGEWQQLIVLFFKTL